MRVLWTVNLVPANVTAKKNMNSEVLGGWVESMAKQLSGYEDIQLFVACRSENGLEFCEEIDGVTYYSLVYSGSSQVDIEGKCADIIKKVKPDLIHIEGTEFPHSGAMLRKSKEMGIPAVVSLQGILNGYYDYQYGMLQLDDMIFSTSLTNIFSGLMMFLRRRLWFSKRLAGEREVIGNADYLLGRTIWDRAHSYALNNHARYYTCNRILRSAFYSENWSIRNCEKHSIYVGNGYNALKGLHFVVKAIPLLVKEYPDIKVYVAGYKPYQENDKRSFIKKGYASYLKKLIKDLDVEKYIEFTGPLGAPQVAKKLSEVNAYVLCSTIENSPNTLGEAMMVGTPCVSAYVGGVQDMVTDGEEALLYRADDHKFLAWQIKRIFDNEELALSLSEKGKKRAQITHNPEINAEKLREAYKDIAADAVKS